jgi:hypothetical protein
MEIVEVGSIGSVFTTSIHHDAGRSRVRRHRLDLAYAGSYRAARRTEELCEQSIRLLKLARAPVPIAFHCRGRPDSCGRVRHWQPVRTG